MQISAPNFGVGQSLDDRSRERDIFVVITPAAKVTGLLYTLWQHNCLSVGDYCVVCFAICIGQLHDRCRGAPEMQSTCTYDCMSLDHRCFGSGSNFILLDLQDSELVMLEDMAPLSEQANDLYLLASSPYELPVESEQILSDLRARCAGIPPSAGRPTAVDSTSSLGSRKSSMTSINSLASSGSASSSAIIGLGGYPNNSIGGNNGFISGNQVIGVQHAVTSSGSIVMSDLMHMGSVSSQDSGFTSQDTLQGKVAMQAQASDTASISSSTNLAKKQNEADTADGLEDELGSSESGEDSDEDARTTSSPVSGLGSGQGPRGSTGWLNHYGTSLLLTMCGIVL